MKKKRGSLSPTAKFLILASLLVLPLLAVSSRGSGTSDASVPAQERKGKNPIAEKYSTLVMLVYFRDRSERDRLASELNAEEVPTTGGYLTVIGDRELYYSVTARGLRVEIDEEGSRNLSDPQILRDTFYGGYKTVEEIYSFLDQKVAQFPNLAEKIDIGDSWCKSNPGACVLPSPWNGYDLWVLHITNRNIPGPKPVFWADGDIHAREIATPEVVMRLIDYLLNNYNTNADVHWLVDYHDIWLMAEVNPDGHHIVEAGGGGNSPYYYRKNGDNVGGGGCSWPPTPYNHFGIDNNRNFPFKWGCCGGSSGSVCDQTYRGTSAGSEPEEMAIVNKIRTLVPDQRGPGDTDPAPITATGVYQNIHTVVPVNLYTWGWSTAQMPNYAETRNIAAHISATNAAGNGYPYGSIIEELYPVDGGSIDWAYGELGMAAISTELSGQDFLPSYSCIDNPGCGSSQGLWPENRGMLLYLAKIARTPYLTSHGPDANTVATNPPSVPAGTPSQLSATINFAWTGNSFSQNVGAAEYYIDMPPWAGGTAIPMSGNFNSVTVPVNATIDTTGMSVGRHVIYVRGRGVNNFQGFQTWGPVSAAFLDVTAACAPGPDYLVASTTGQAMVPGTTQVPGSVCNVCTVTVPLPFNYSLYGTSYSQVVASNSGTLQFTGNTSNNSNTCLPAASHTDTIFAYWDDLNTNISDTLGIFTSVSGTAPNRIFNIEWRAGYEASDATSTFEVRLYEGQPRYEVIYANVTRHGFSATVGVQQGNGAVHRTQYACNTQNTIQNGQKLTFDLRACQSGAPDQETVSSEQRVFSYQGRTTNNFTLLYALVN